MQDTNDCGVWGELSVLLGYINALEDRVTELEGKSPDPSAPEWANYKAMDKDGTWHFYEHSTDVDYEEHLCSSISGVFERMEPQPPRSDKHWTDTLEEL